MGIKARAEYTVSVVNDGKGERTYIRYSDDNGKTFTKSVLNHITGDTYKEVKGENRSGQVPAQWNFKPLHLGMGYIRAVVEISGNTTNNASMCFQTQPDGGLGGYSVLIAERNNVENGKYVFYGNGSVPEMTGFGKLNLRLDNVNGIVKVLEIQVLSATEYKIDNLLKPYEQIISGDKISYNEFARGASGNIEQLITFYRDNTDNAFVPGKLYCVEANVKTSGNVKSMEVFIYDNKIKSINRVEYANNVLPANKWQVIKTYIRLAKHVEADWSHVYVRFDNNGSLDTKSSYLNIKKVRVSCIDDLIGINQANVDCDTWNNVSGTSRTYFTEQNLPNGAIKAVHVHSAGGNGGIFFPGENFVYPDASMDVKFSVYMRSNTAGLQIYQHIEGNNSVTHTLTPEWKRYEVGGQGASRSHTLCLYTNKAGDYDVCCPQFMIVRKGEAAPDWIPSKQEEMIGMQQGSYLGIVSWDKNYPPLNPNAYTWSEFKGQDAEMYKLNPLEESAIVGEYGECNIDLQYEIKHVVGNKETKYTGDDITISVDNRVNEIMFMKTPAGSWECRVAIVDFTKKNLGSFSVNIMKGQQVLDTRVVPVTYNTNVLLEASQKLGTITASVKGVSKLIHNMFVGSTFLEPIEGVWMMFGAAVDKGVKYNGSDVVLIQNIGATQDSYHGVYFFVEGLMPQKKYTISAMVRTDNLKGMDEGAAIEIKMTDNRQDVRLCDPFPIVLTKENEWQKVEFTFTAPGRITSEKVQVRFQLWRNGHLWISQPMMNAGEVAADYTANIKDIQLSLAQIKLTANTISQSITDLSTGLESVGIHLNGAEKKITLHGDTEMVDANGKHVAMFKDGKIITEAIDADKVVTKGIQSKTIDAKDATFENVNIKGVLDSVSGTFKVLKCVDKDGKEIATLRFGNQGTLTIEGGDLFMQGMKIDRNLRFYASDIWCRGAFGAAERTVMVVKGSKADCYINGVKKEPITVSFTSLTGSDGRTYYKIPCYSPGYMMGLGISGFPVDTVLFNISDTDNHFFELDMYETQRCMVINANDDADNIYIYSNGKPVEWKGGEIAEVLQLPLKLTNPEVSMNIVGAGTIIGAFRDNDW